MSMRSGASVSHDFALSSFPRGDRITRAASRRAPLERRGERSFMEHSGRMDDAWQPKCHDLIPVRQLAQKEPADRTDVLRLGLRLRVRHATEDSCESLNPQ